MDIREEYSRTGTMVKLMSESKSRQTSRRFVVVPFHKFLAYACEVYGTMFHVNLFLGHAA